MTAGELHDALSRLGADLMVRALAALSRGALASRRRRPRASPTRESSTRTRAGSTGRAGSGPRPGPRPLAGARRVLRPCTEGAAHQGAALGPCRRHGVPGTLLAARPPSLAARARCASPRPAGRPAGDGGGRFPARHEDRARNAAVVMIRPERAEDVAAIRRHSRLRRFRAPPKPIWSSGCAATAISPWRLSPMTVAGVARLRGLSAKLVVDDGRRHPSTSSGSRRVAVDAALRSGLASAAR